MIFGFHNFWQPTSWDKQRMILHSKQLKSVNCFFVSCQHLSKWHFSINLMILQNPNLKVIYHKEITLFDNTTYAVIFIYLDYFMEWILQSFKKILVFGSVSIKFWESQLKKFLEITKKWQKWTTTNRSYKNIQN